MTDIDSLRYPVGPMPRLTTPLGAAGRSIHLAVLEQTPSKLRALVEPLSEAQLDTAYRPGGWTIRQVVHHVPDSHLNAYLRMKFAATEDAPTVKPYDEERWAELPEARSGPTEMSLTLLDGLHARWVAFLRALPEASLQRHFVHAQWGRVTIEEALVMYAWHCRHHTAHVENRVLRF